MKTKIDNIFTSGWSFTDSQMDLRSKFQMINVGIILSSASIIYGVITNIVRDTPTLVPIELVILFVNVIIFFVLRVSQKYFALVATILTAQFTFLMLLLVYISDPLELKHVWLYTYPIVILYFQKIRAGILWVLFMLTMLLISPFQTFLEVQYSFFQISYISFVFIIVSLIVYFYHYKMDEARDIILDFNANLEGQVKDKTAELRELNESLELKVQDKIDELIQKDKILTVQSKQAVMGEMISMIAHQWRQPLSTITLQISNFEIKKLLGNKVGEEELEKSLHEISNTIVYLSDTIDDFQTYFHPAKDSVDIEIHVLLQRAINFALPRVNEFGIKISFEKSEETIINTYINELIQVVLNILNNAIDALFINESKDPLIKVSAKDKDDLVYIIIEDNAGGINHDNIPLLFEPYFSTKGKNGTGLGLYMCQMIVQKQLDGEIIVENIDGGARFTVKVPKHVK